MAYRFDAVCRTAAALIRQGVVVVSPIAHSHPIFVCDPETGSSFEAWQQLDEALIIASEEMWVLALPGWDESRGVRSEIQFCIRNGIPVHLVDRQGENIDAEAGGVTE